MTLLKSFIRRLFMGLRHGEMSRRRQILSSLPVSTVGISAMTGIGNAIMALPMVHQIGAFDPSIKIVVLTIPDNEDVFRHCPGVHQIIVARGWVRAVQALRVQRCDVLLNSFSGMRMRDALIPFLARIPRRISHIYSYDHPIDDFSFLFTDRVRVSPEEHDIVRNLKLLEEAGIQPAYDRVCLRFHVSEEQGRRARRALQEAGFSKEGMTVGVHPGCSNANLGKRWPAGHFSELMRLLSKNSRVNFMLFGGERERDLAASIEKQAGVRGVNLAGRCSLGESAWALTQCDFLISNDSAVSHLAAAVNVPVFAIFLASDAIRTRPFGPHHTIITSLKFDCHRLQNELTWGHSLVRVPEITPAAVFDAIISSGVWRQINPPIEG